jgi:hypothetical protein
MLKTKVMVPPGVGTIGQRPVPKYGFRPPPARQDGAVVTAIC